MRNKFKRLAAGLLSVVLAMTVLLPFALAVNCDGDEGIAPHSVRCPNCGWYEVSTLSQRMLVKCYGSF